MKQQNQAFTLLETAIAILIISLIIGSILIGQDLIQGARNQGLISDFERYESAYKTFRLKYKRSPGDMSNAFEYFGTVIGCSDDDVNDSNNGCNGDGNGRIGNQNLNDAENLRAHQHLTASNILSTVGLSSSIDTSSIVIKQNSPLSLYNNSATYFFSSDDLGGNYKNINSLSISSTQNNGWNNPVVTSQNALSIDSKIDDGRPYTGKIISYNQNDNECVVQSLTTTIINNKNDAEYIANNNSSCVVRIGLSGQYR